MNWQALNQHQNWVDYLSSPQARSPASFIYALVLLAALASTLGVGLIITPKLKGYSAFLFASYCLICLGGQAVATWKWAAETLPIQGRKN